VAVTEDDLKTAEQRMSEVMRSTPRAVSAHYDRRVSRVAVSLDSGRELAFRRIWPKASARRSRQTSPGSRLV
jgi:hypothetical protein